MKLKNLLSYQKRVLHAVKRRAATLLFVCAAPFSALLTANGAEPPDEWINASSGGVGNFRAIDHEKGQLFLPLHAADCLLHMSMNGQKLILNKMNPT
jgi:hypothetical protein